MTYLYNEAIQAALLAVSQETERQEQLKEEGKFTHVAGDYGLTTPERFVMLCEEVGELAREIFEDPAQGLVRDGTGTPENLEKELTQVAAIAVSWLAGIRLRRMVNM